jgi:hypothetical protein
MVMEVEMLAMFDGHNEQEVYAAQRACGIFHAAVPEPENFVLGICSVEEMGVCRGALSPAHEKVHKAHLLAIHNDDEDGAYDEGGEYDGGGGNGDGGGNANGSGSGNGSDSGSGSGGGGEGTYRQGGGVRLKLRATSGPRKGTIYYHRVPAGTVIVNCTDSLATKAQADSWEPLVSGGGLVLAPQVAMGFTGPSATLLTHAWYCGTLDKVWRKLFRVYWGPKDKGKIGISTIYMLICNVFLMKSAIPLTVQFNDYSSPASLVPFHRRILTIFRLGSTVPPIIRKHRSWMTLRWDDDKGEGAGGGGGEEGEEGEEGGALVGPGGTMEGFSGQVVEGLGGTTGAWSSGKDGGGEALRSKL